MEGHKPPHPAVDARGSNLHAAVSALLDRASSQSDAIAEFYSALEARRKSDTASLLARDATVAARERCTTQVTSEKRDLVETAKGDTKTQGATKQETLVKKESALAKGLLVTRRDHSAMMFSQFDALHEGQLKAALNEALTQLSALEDDVLPSLERQIESRRREALANAERTINTLSAKVREAEEEEATVDAAIWEAETVLALLATQSSTMRRVISKRSEITETGLEEVIAREAASDREKERKVAEEAADILRKATDFF